ncbi:MAG: hypothetical protein LBB31_04915 [Prevotellaceae bacterium]|jgi:hypothetical protein|nr:hypothetical protein [Prevotellaceae bacterium]
MYRQVFIPNEQNSHVLIPREWYGQLVEIIAFPVTTSHSQQRQTNDDDFYKLAGAWESDQSATEMAAELKAARKFGKRNLSF